MAIRPVISKVKTEQQQKYRDFWMQFNNYVRNEKRFTTEFKPHTFADVRSYQDYSVNCSFYHLTTKIDFKKQECRVGVYFRNVDEWHHYFAIKKEIEQSLGRTLEWDVQKTKGSVYWSEPMPLDDKDSFDNVFEWMVSKMIVMKREFAKHIRKRYFLRSANTERFLLSRYLSDYKEIDWGDYHQSYNVGDIVFVYYTEDTSSIRYMFEVTKVNIPFEEQLEIDGKKYWGAKHEKENEIDYEEPCFRLKLLDEVNSPDLKYAKLSALGLKYVFAPCELKGKVLDYILSFFSFHSSDEIENPEGIYEGAKKTIVVNSYERNIDARRRCLDANGYKCAVCGIDFEETYGEIGHGFIHVHHIVPISTIGKEYIINPTKDLVPVCPNCHAMLHRRKPPLEVDELRQILHKKGQKVKTL